MSIASSSYKPKSFQQSSDLEDLRQQVRLLVQENKILTGQLEELIEVNNELTSSIEEYSKLHEEKFGPIDHQQLEELANQVALLQKELEQQREKTYQIVMSTNQRNYGDQRNYPDEKDNNRRLTNNSSNRDNIGPAAKPYSHSRTSSRQQLPPAQQSQPLLNIDEIYEVIRQLTSTITFLQSQYKEQIQSLTQQLQQHQMQSTAVFEETQRKFQSFEEMIRDILNQMKEKDSMIARLEREINLHKTKKSQIQKQMKISLTIQDLRTTLERKIQEKDAVIKAYQKLINDLKGKVVELN